MALELEFNPVHGTLDLLGNLPASAKRKAKDLLTYNPQAGCYQGAPTKQVLDLAVELHAEIAPEAVRAVRDNVKTPPGSQRRAPRTTENDDRHGEEDRSVGPRSCHHGLGVGWVVKHAEFGFGKTATVTQGRITVAFVRDNRTITLTDDSVLSRLVLPDGTRCRTAKGEMCKVVGRQEFAQGRAAKYRVEYETGLQGTLLESDLEPLDIPPPASPLEALASLRHGPFGLFSSREALRMEQLDLLRRGGGVKALLSSRIDLRPHQAFVAGAVILDPCKRYLLADEVGLGKTIEAGIVIHDLLCKRPQANILVLCPTSLVQQWLCEIYAKFCGHVFRIPEMTGQDWEEPARVIFSLARAPQARDRLMKVSWDLVVVDETHHLLSDKALYGLAMDIAKRSPGLLLLSALPAQHREDEFLRLLALLEPDRYRSIESSDVSDFRELYQRQTEIGRKLGYIVRRLEENAQDPSWRQQITLKLTELAGMPVLRADKRLREACTLAGDRDDQHFTAETQDLVHYIGDAYRINRRIFRNRRSRLIELGQMDPIERVLVRVPYKPDQFELDAENAVHELLRNLWGARGAESAAQPLARQLLQSLCCPQALAKCLSAAAEAQHGRETLVAADALVGYEDWDAFAATLWTKSGAASRAAASLDRAISAAEAWCRSPSPGTRFETLARLLCELQNTRRGLKLIVFAGFPTTASIVADVLTKIFSPKAVARFHYGMKGTAEEERKAKEQEVRRFQRDPDAWLLVSDETGGEGRNFQFADGTVFFDLPWQLSKAEQRIGRLDRLGRQQPSVRTHVLFSEGSTESGLLECYESGFGVFSRSISGLEFALRDLEAKIAETAITEGTEGLLQLPTMIKEQADKERAEDEAHELLDAASYERRRAERFLKAQSTEQQDLQIEKSFIRYIRSSSQKDGAEYIKDAWGDDHVVRFRPDSIQGLSLSIRKAPNGATPDPIGTFRRALAQERPDLQFFSVGNELFDAVSSSLEHSTSGRSYAIECNVQARAWRGFEFRYTIAGRPAAQQESLLCVDWALSGQTTRVFISDEGNVENDDRWIKKVKSELTKENKGRAWRNLDGERAKALTDFYGEAPWIELVRRCEEVGSQEARRKLKERTEVSLITELERLEREIATVQRRKTNGWKESSEQLAQRKKALTEWSVSLDSIGFLSINGGLNGGAEP